MDFSEEELNQYRKGPQKGIVDVFVHHRELLALGVSLFGRHGGYLDHEDAAGKGKEDYLCRCEGEIGVASYGWWCVVVRGFEGKYDSDSDRGVTAVCSALTAARGR